MHPLHMLFLSLALNGTFFVLAAILRTDVFTDITYSLTFVVLAILLFLAGPGVGILHWIVPALVVLWGARLGAYLFRRILHMKVDHRFDDKRNNPLRFGVFWLLQALTAWLVMLPAWGLATRSPEPDLPPWVLAVSVTFFLGGLLLETVADAQKYRFKKDPAHKSLPMTRGVWKWSRHPNYFGEIILWWALSFPGIFLFHDWELLYFLGPAFLTLMICFVSGIPLLEKSAAEKWGNDPAWCKYRDSTSLLIPLPPRKD